ncbi:MAG: hypothetical protein AAGF85_06595 [Bacteroidota bacterium]
MNYKLFDINGHEIAQKNLQDKAYWCTHGESIEASFVNQYGTQLKTIINPEKKINRYAPDLLCSGEIADLKTQNTPFFKSGKLYGLDPTYTVVFNKKDRERYYDMYPELIVVFWVNWQVIKMNLDNTEYSCRPLNGVWAVRFGKLNALCNEAPLHYYDQRKFDQLGNAKCSYVLSLKSFRKII